MKHFYYECCIIFVCYVTIISGYLHFSYKFHFHFCEQEMRYYSDDAPWTGER